METKGYLALVLHAHLPFVRHPGEQPFLEENWLFEAIIESYVPLLDMLGRLEASGVDSKLTFTLTPTLCAMLRDEMLIERCSKRLKGLAELSEKEMQRLDSSPHFLPAAGHYRERFANVMHSFENKYKRDIIGAFKSFQDKGRLSVLACSATHALLPLLDDPAAVKAQIMTGIIDYEKNFGHKPSGFWIPECAYTPLVGRTLADCGINYFILDTHGVLYGEPRPGHGVYSPVLTPEGVAAFARDPESSKQVWSAQTGYPGDPAYREFYRDLGWDAELDYIQDYLVAPDLRHDLGIKYHRVTGKVPLEDKDLYNPEVACRKAVEHAKHFLASRSSHLLELSQLLDGCKPVIVSPYDAELYGHWWYEGPLFLETLLSEASGVGLSCVTPDDILKEGRELQTQQPATSSWGFNGYFETWLSGHNDWIYPMLHESQAKMSGVCCKGKTPGSLENRALAQMTRELLLAQSSDWAFILNTGTMTEYARRRVIEHIDRFNALEQMVSHENIDEVYLKSIEDIDNIFPWLDYSIFCPDCQGSGCEG